MRQNRRSPFTGSNLLLLCGIASSVLYACITVYVAAQWDSYSPISQTVSELSAIGAPTRALWAWLVAPYTLLVIAFGIGVWISADGNRALRVTGTLITVYGALGLAWPFAPMHQRETLAAGGSTVSDTLHLALGGVTVLLMLMAIAFAAVAFGKWFRVYSLATLAILLVFGALTFLDAPNIGTNLPTPWVGLWERINIGAFLLWIAVLAVRMLSPGGLQLVHWWALWQTRSSR